MGATDKPLDNPINWSFKMGRLFDIDIRVHVAFIICAVVLIWMELPERGSGEEVALGRILVDAVGTYALLFLIVLLHEFGHCFGARYTGGEADEILLWPLGGLAYVNPPHTASAHMATTAAGPLVNVLICALCSVTLVVWMGHLGAVPWNPLYPFTPVSRPLWYTANLGQLWVMRFYGISYFLLLINLLPIFPFDGGRIVQAWLWPKKGYRASMEIATATGMIGAIVIGVFGLFLEESWLLLMIAFFGYITCWQTRRALKEGAEFAGGEFGYDFSQGYTSLERADTKEPKPGFFARRRAKKAAAKEERQRQGREEHKREVERILRKISETGMASLSAKERRILERETERQRTTYDTGSDALHP